MRAKIITLLSLSILALSIGTAQAIPKLQVYIPGAIYDQETETWIIYSYDYDLWVIGAHEEIYGVKIALAVPTDEDGSIGITWKQGSFNDGTRSRAPDDSDILDELVDDPPYISFTAYGTPTMGDGSPLPPHGVFPTSYYEYFIGDFDTSQTVFNYIPGEEWMDEAQGETKKFDISVSGYTTVDIVAYDHYLQAQNKARYIFSPFSHDANSTIPEPTTLILLGTGLMGIAAFGRRKFKTLTSDE